MQMKRGGLMVSALASGLQMNGSGASLDLLQSLVWALVGDIVLCIWARYFTLTV